MASAARNLVGVDSQELRRLSLGVRRLTRKGRIFGSEDRMEEKKRTLLARIRLPLIGMAVFFGLAMVPVVLQTRQVTSFCADIHVNMPVSELPSVAEAHGIDKRLVIGVSSERRKDWVFVIPVSPVGESKCIVRHDGKLVTSAEISSW